MREFAGVEVWKIALGIYVMICVAIFGALFYQLFEKSKRKEGCDLVSQIVTDETTSCGKACTRPVVVNTYQCPSGRKVWVE